MKRSEMMSKIMKYAHSIKAKFVSFGAALKAAWAWFKGEIKEVDKMKENKKLSLKEKAEKMQRFIGQSIAYLIIDEIDNDAKLIFRDKSKKFENVGRYVGKDKFKNPRFQVDLMDADKAQVFYTAFMHNYKLENFKPVVKDDKIIINNNYDIAAARKDLRQMDADLINPDSFGGYMRSYYEIDKNVFLADLRKKIEKKQIGTIWEDVLKNVVGFDVYEFINEI